MSTEKKTSSYRLRMLTTTAMLGAMAGLLMLIEIPLGFIAPSFYKIDLSEVPVMIPMYTKFMPIEQIVEAGKAIIPWVKDTFTFCLYCVLPFNLIKGVIVSLIVAIIYKPLSRLIHKGI